MNKQTLKKIQEIQLEMLLEFDKICRENNMKYHLNGGTLIGAIRHKGFIPWDDDIDVVMLRSDYEKFIKLSKTKLNKKYFLQYYMTDSEFPHSFLKIRKNNTKFVEDKMSDFDIHHGIFIDVFPLDKTKPDSILGKLQMKSLGYIRKIKNSKNKKIIKSSNNKLIKYLRIIVYFLFKPISFKSINKFETMIATYFEDKNINKITILTFGNKHIYDRFLMDISDFYNLRELKFENHIFYGPEKYDMLLKQAYGDYMKLPPKEDRKPQHGIKEISFGDNL